MENKKHGSRKDMMCGKRGLVKMAEKMGYTFTFRGSDYSCSGMYYINISKGDIYKSFRSWHEFSYFIKNNYFKEIFSNGGCF